VKFSRTMVHSKAISIPTIRFDKDSRLTSFAGLVVFQKLFKVLNLRQRIAECFSHLDGDSKILGFPKAFLILVIHLLLGFRRLRGMNYYRHDPLVAHVLGLKILPDVSTLTRTLSECDDVSVNKVRALVRHMTIERIRYEKFPRITFDFDGSVQSTKGHIEGTAVGFNKVKKGARSYYPLFCTIAQTGQFFDMHHRPGNVHDSNGATEFMTHCFSTVKKNLGTIVLEARFDSTFFDEERIDKLIEQGIEFTGSVPFERFAELKKLIEEQKVWNDISGGWWYAEVSWKPKKWKTKASVRFIFYRQRVTIQQKGPLQLDLFTPKDFKYEYKVIVTNKEDCADTVLHFHNGRGSQEKVLGEAKQHVALDIIATHGLVPNRLFTLASLLSHNLSREVQMGAREPERGTLRKRPARWEFSELGTMRQNFLHRAGRLLNPQGRLTLVINANPAVENDLQELLVGQRFAA